MLRRNIPQQNNHINIGQRVAVNVINLAVLGMVGLIVKGCVGFNEADSRRERGGKSRDEFRVVGYSPQQIARSGEVEHRGVLLQILGFPNIPKITAVRISGKAGAGTFSNYFF